MESYGPHQASPRDVMMRFASLGTSCEFGFAQRAHGAESFDLFRWAGTSVPVLVRLLSERLSEIGDAAQIEIRSSDSGEWTGSHRKYGFAWHTFVQPGRRMSLDALHRRECARISRLADIFVDHLTLGDRIFVLAGSDLSETAVQPLVDAIRAYGPAPLLFVTSTSSRSRAGTVEVVDDGLLHGYLERFANPANMPATTDARSWLAICQASVRALRDVDASHLLPAAKLEFGSGDGVLAADDDSWEAEALATARQAVALGPMDPENYAHIAWLLENKGELDAAARELRFALDLRPEESRYAVALEGIDLRKRRRELTVLLDEVIFDAVQLALRDREHARRVLASLFPSLYYFTPWVKVCRRFAPAETPQRVEREALLREALLPLLELCDVDEEFYARRHPDVQDGLDNGTLESLSRHWRTHGYFEGRAYRSDNLTDS